MTLKQAILGFIIFLAIACSPNAQDVEQETVNIEGCEYISGWKGGYHGGPIFTHKGNCSNPIHAYRREESQRGHRIIYDIIGGDSAKDYNAYGDTLFFQPKNKGRAIYEP